MPTQVRLGTAQDQPRIRELLTAARLPTEDLVDSAPSFLVVVDETQALVGVGALQWLGKSALIRSVVVAAQVRETGLGRQIVAALERVAKDAKVTELYLLTTTAQAFFERLGYVVTDRSSAPTAVQRSLEFRLLCPSTAICMSKVL